MQNYQVDHEYGNVNPLGIHGMEPLNSARSEVLTRNELSWKELSNACRNHAPFNRGDIFVDYVFEARATD